MSLTERIARVVRATGGESDEAYECKTCGATFTLDRQTCPDCGGCTIDRTDWDGVVSR